jgi:hypothetical protein
VDQRDQAQISFAIKGALTPTLFFGEVNGVSFEILSKKKPGIAGLFIC